MSADYAAACKAAATRQGLDPIMCALDDVGIYYRLEQTGGFCMVVVVPIEGLGNIAIIDDGDIMCGLFTGDTWRDGGSEAAEDFLAPSIAEAVQFVAHVMTRGAQR